MTEIITVTDKARAEKIAQMIQRHCIQDITVRSAETVKGQWLVYCEETDKHEEIMKALAMVVTTMTIYLNLLETI